MKTAVPVGELMATAKDAAGPLLRNLQLFDRYQGKGVPDDAHSLAMTLTFQDPERTLKAQEVDARIQAVVVALATQHGAELRS